MMGSVKLVILFVGILFLTLGTNGGLMHQPVPVPDHDDTVISKSVPAQTLRYPSFALDDGSDNLAHYAVYKSYSKDTMHYGAMATMDVYGVAISPDQETAAIIWVGNPGNGGQSTQNFILAGWHVKPSLYGDSRTRFFTYWTKDGFLTTGCYNTACPGLQLQPGSRAFPGDVIDPVSRINGPKHNITIKVHKDESGDWWIHYGFNSPPTAVGHFPSSLFTGLANSTVDFAFGGYASNAITASTPPMGSGSSQIGSAASFSDLQYVLQDGTMSAVRGNLPSSVDNRSCYTVTPIVDGKFFYGGPGGCLFS